MLVSIKFSLKKFDKLVVVFIILLVLVAIFFTTRIPLNTYFAGTNLSAISKNAAEELVESSFSKFEQSDFIFLVDDKTISIPVKEAGITLNREETNSSLFSTTKLENGIIEFFERKEVYPVYAIDFTKFFEKVIPKLSESELTAVNSTIGFDGSTYYISEPKQGRSINQSKLSMDLSDRILKLSNEPVFVEFIDTEPKINKDQAERALERVKTLANQNIVLTFESDKWPLTNQQIFDILDFRRNGAQNGDISSFFVNKSPIDLVHFKTSNSQAVYLETVLDETALDDFVSDIASEIDRKRTDATLRFENGVVSEFTPATNGKILDREQTKTLILDVISIENVNKDKSISIALPVKVEKAKIENEEINQLGIKELIGSGVSYYRGSIPNRVFNLTLGTNRLSGTLIPPGETFSFNSAVGEISSATGYKEAYVISKGRTVLDDGGGICQVSTTAFRAALNSGLPITNRTAHAYRVSYYEQGFKPGIDATIWQPSVDLKFLNDTNKHLLIQAIVDPALSKLQVDIYGTSDGREVEISEPVVSNIRPAPEPLYQDDPSLPAGTIKQVDYAAAGATTVFTRIVKKNGQVIVDESFKSNFRPWQAVYLVGSGS